jgi:hypothetical protein
MGALVVCLAGSPLTGTLFASDARPETFQTAPPAHETSTGAMSAAPASREVNGAAIVATVTPDTLASAIRQSYPPAPLVQSPFAISDPTVTADSFALGGRYGRWRGRNGAARAEVVLGAVASITGAALLVYANRPECRTNELASGCGYGTKVVGGAVLSGGLVSLVVGALTWRR